MGSLQSKKIEEQVKSFLLTTLNVDVSYLYEPEFDETVRQILKIKNFNKTPDFILSNDINNQVIKDMFFIEVNEITGGILNEDDVYQNIPIPTRIGTADNPVRVLLNPSYSNVGNSTMNKVKKTYQKYSIERENSINLGIIFKIDKKINYNYTYENIDLTSSTLPIYVLDIAKELSNGSVGRSKVLGSAQQIIDFTFANTFKNLGFVLFLGDGASCGYSYCFINRRILHKKEHIITKLHNYYKSLKL